VVSKLVHVLEGHVVHVFVRKLALDEVVGAMAGLAGFAIDHRVIERRNVAGGFPHAGIHENGGIESDVRGGFLDESLPPHRTNVPFELRA